MNLLLSIATILLPLLQLTMTSSYAAAAAAAATATTTDRALNDSNDSNLDTRILLLEMKAQMDQMREEIDFLRKKESQMESRMREEIDRVINSNFITKTNTRRTSFFEDPTLFKEEANPGDDESRKLQRSSRFSLTLTNRVSVTESKIFAIQQKVNYICNKNQLTCKRPRRKCKKRGVKCDKDKDKVKCCGILTCLPKTKKCGLKPKPVQCKKKGLPCNNDGECCRNQNLFCGKVTKKCASRKPIGGNCGTKATDCTVDEDCCSNLFCGPVTRKCAIRKGNSNAPNSDCGETGATCTKNNDCCLNLNYFCNNANRCALKGGSGSGGSGCIAKGNQCSNNGNKKCCNNLVCKNSECSEKSSPAPTCIAEGDACTNNGTKCCNSLVCANSKCSKKEPAPQPQPQPQPQPAPSDDGTLPYKIEYTIDQAGTPSIDDYNRLTDVTATYLFNKFKAVYGDDFVSAPTNRVGDDDNEVSYTTTVNFASTLQTLPTDEELEEYLQDFFTSDSADYLESVMDLEDDNVFSTTTAFDFTPSS